MHQNRFRLGLRPQTLLGDLTASPDALAVFKGPTSKGKEGKGKRGEKGKGGEGVNDLTHPLSQIPGYATGL